MEDLEKKIESYALRLSNLKPGFDRQEEEYYQSEKVRIYDLVKQIIKSDLAKTFHQQGMYSEEDLINFSVWCGINYISYHSQRNNKRIWFDPDNVKYLTTEKLLDIWLDQNKKK